jgi:hypothetical protein
MTAALEYHSIGVLSVFLSAPKAFERSLCINLELLRRKKRNLDFLVPIFVCILYPMSRRPWPGHVLPLVERGLLDTHLLASSVFSFVIHPKPDLSTTLKSSNTALTRSQDNLRIITQTHTPQAYVPSYIITTTTPFPLSKCSTRSIHSPTNRLAPPGQVWLFRRMRLLLAGSGLLLIGAVLIHLSLLFSAGQGAFQVDCTGCHHHCRPARIFEEVIDGYFVVIRVASRLEEFCSVSTTKFEKILYHHTVSICK